MNHFEENCPDFDLLKKLRKSINTPEDIQVVLNTALQHRNTEVAAHEFLRTLDAVTWIAFDKSGLSNFRNWRIAECPWAAAYFQAVLNTLPTKEVRFRTRMLLTMWHVEKVGSPIYRVSPGLSHALANTELRGLTCDDLRLPYKALYIEIPSEDLKVWNPQSGWHVCQGMYLLEDFLGGESGSHEWGVMLVGRAKGALGTFMGRDVPNDAVSYYDFRMPEGMTLEDALQMNGQKYQDEQHLALFGEMANHWQESFKWAMNFALYVTNVEQGVKMVTNPQYRQLSDRLKKARGKKASSIAARLSTISRRERIVIGEGFCIKGAQERGPTVRVLVAGHWKRVHHGPKHSLTKKAFIEPYWRGPDIHEGVISKKVVTG